MIAAKMVQLELAIQLHACLVKVAGGGGTASTAGAACVVVMADDISRVLFGAVLATSFPAHSTASIAATILQQAARCGALPALRCLAGAGRFFAACVDDESAAVAPHSSGSRCAVM